MLHVLFYDYIPDIAVRRPEFRVDHLAMLRQLHEAGKLRMAGAFENPLDSAALVFTDRAAAEQFVEHDPYFVNGLVTKYWIRDWNVVLGE